MKEYLNKPVAGIIALIVSAIAVWFLFLSPVPGQDSSAAVDGNEQAPSPELYQAPVQERTMAPETSATFVVTVVDDVVVATDDITREDAQAQCEAVAYNTDYMFQQVVCTYNGEEFYNDIFIAG